MKNRKRFLCLLMAFALLVPFTASALGLESSSRNININNAEDFIEFVNFCAIDSWSKGKNITLNANIDLSDYPDVTVGSFSGTFDGAGHKISGLQITDAGSYRGLFRYLQSGGVIKGLTVSGTVTPSGAAEFVGGIVAENRGTVQSSVFTGTVGGQKTVGGIVGVNCEGAKVIECTFKGTLTGAETVGGIAGENGGTLSKCENEAAVCTDTSAEDLYDIGGIAGHSTGAIQSCTNRGNVGVNHLGYNIGGVVGRQEGVVTNSGNYGAIFGRKDVGGVTGQAEPSITVLLTDDMLAELSGELAKLNSQISSFTTSPDISGDIQKKLNSASNYLSTANSSANSLMTQLAGAVSGGGSGTTTNNSTQVIYDNLGNYSSIFTGMSDTVTKLSAANDQLIMTIGDLITAGNTDADSLTSAQTAANGIKTALTDTDEAITELSKQVVTLRKEVYDESENGMGIALSDIERALTSLGDCFEKLAAQIKDLTDGLDGLVLDSDKNDTCQKELRSLSDAFADMGRRADELVDTVDDIEPQIEVNWSSLRTTLSLMEKSAQEMASDSAKKAMENIQKALEEYEAPESTKEAVEKLADLAKTAAGHLNTLSNDISKAQTNLKELAEAKTSTGTSTSTGSTSTYNTQAQNLYKAIVNLSSEITDIGTVLGRDTSGKESEQAKAINDQMLKVMELMVAAMEDSGSAGSVTDVSESASSKAAAGKLEKCMNYGPVTGDRDVGGVAGSLAIEGTLDPEEDNGDPFSAEHQYEIMDIVTGCLNDGEITGLSSGTGGIIGRMELGTAVNCENYGSVTGGDYTGGIAGYTAAPVKKSYNKSAVTGEKYVGGIAGYGVKLEANFAIVVINGTEYVGSIAGQIDNTEGNVKNNIFLTNNTGAIDGVSFAGVAEPISDVDLKKRTGLPAGFAVFTVTCIADDAVVDTVKVDYRTLMKDVKLPDVPEKDGKSGVWSEFTMDRMLLDQTVYAVYDSPKELISSVELDGGRAFALAEGVFTKYAVLHVYDSEAPYPSTDSWALWDVILEDAAITDDSVTKIRLLNQSGGDATVWRYADERWTEVPSVKNGSYLTVTMTGSTGTFCMMPDYTTVILLAVIIGSAVVAAMVVIFILVLRHRRRNPPRRRKADRPNPKRGEEQIRPMYLSPEFTVPSSDSEPTMTPYDEPMKLPEEDNPLIIHASQELEKWSDIMEGDAEWGYMTPKEKRAYKKQMRLQAKAEKRAIKSAEKQAKAEERAAKRQARKNKQ